MILKRISLHISLFLLWAGVLCLSNLTYANKKDSLFQLRVKRGVSQFEQLIAQNKRNTQLGQGYRNRYVFGDYVELIGRKNLLATAYGIFTQADIDTVNAQLNRFNQAQNEVVFYVYLTGFKVPLDSKVNIINIDSYGKYQGDYKKLYADLNKKSRITLQEAKEYEGTLLKAIFGKGSKKTTHPEKVAMYGQTIFLSPTDDGRGQLTYQTRKFTGLILSRKVAAKFREVYQDFEARWRRKPRRSKESAPAYFLRVQVQSAIEAFEEQQVAPLPQNEARVAYRAMRRAFAYFFGSTQGIEANRNLLNAQNLGEVNALITKQPWSQTASAAFSFQDEKDGIAGVQDFWKKASPALRQDFKDGLQCITKIDEVTRSCARDVLKIYLKGLFKSLPADFPTTYAGLKTYKSQVFGAPRYRIAFDLIRSIFPEQLDNAIQVTKSLSRLIGGIVSLVTLDELSGAYANQETWALNMTKASVSQLGAGLGAVAPAVGKALSTIGILVVKVVIVAVAVYVAYRALKLMWKLAVWVAYKIRDYFTKEKPDEEESKECEDWNASNAMIVYDILEKAIQYFFEDKDKGKPWQYAIKTIRRRHGAKVLLQNKSNPTVKAFLAVACCALQNQSNVTEQCALDILKAYLGNRIFNLDVQNKKAEAYATLQDYYKRHELFFLWQIDRILIGNLEAVDHTRYLIPEIELTLKHKITDKLILKDLLIPADKINKMTEMHDYIIQANKDLRHRYRENPYKYSLDNCTHCTIAFNTYLNGIKSYPTRVLWPLSLTRFF